MAGPIGRFSRKVLGRTIRALGVYGPARTAHLRAQRWTPARIAERKRWTAFYSQFFKAGDTVFDVGANLGNRSEVFLALGAKVIAVEPQPICQDVLQRLFGRHPRFVLARCALGDAPGEATMFVADMSGLSTLSTEWMDKLKASGRLEGHKWTGSITVPVRTMDSLIAEHGVPAFCKIDVEGFEINVLRGLSRPIRALSFELASEAADSAVACIERLGTLATYEFNYSKFESMTYVAPAWLSGPAMVDVLRNRLEPMFFGDIYARVAG